jgi:hypothetical protein
MIPKKTWILVTNKLYLDLNVNIFGLEALKRFLESIDDEQLYPFLHSINLLNSNLILNTDMENFVSESNDP